MRDFKNDRFRAFVCGCILATICTLPLKFDAENNSHDNKQDGTQTLVLVLAIVSSAAGLATYIVKITNAVNKLESTLQKQISTETFALSEKIIKSRDEQAQNYISLKSDLEKQLAQQREYLHTEISGNRESISAHSSDNKIKYLEIVNQLENIKRDFVNLQQSLIVLLRQQDCRMQDLESFTAKKLEYEPRKNTANLSIESL